MKKYLWISLISLTVVLLILEIGFVFLNNELISKELKKMENYKESQNVKNKPLHVQPKKKQTNTNLKIHVPQPAFFPKASETVLKEVNGWKVVNNPNSLLVVVNKERKLPDNFIPKQLIEPDVKFSFPEKDDRRLMRAVAALALEGMFNEAEKEGIHLYAVSGYRSYEYQISVHSTHVKILGEKQADAVSAVPGSSEHETGLAMDISSQSVDFNLTTQFGNVPEGIWVNKNAHKFGFIIRYPKDKTTITKYDYEPWHIRYVGKDYATYLYNNNLTLEEAIHE